MSTEKRNPVLQYDGDFIPAVFPAGREPTPLTPYVSALAGRPDSTAAMTACRAVRASLDSTVDDRWASLRASPWKLAERSTQRRHNNERVDMNEDEAARIAARLKEVEEKVARLEELARQVSKRGPATSSAQ
ncbi:hypothetical protein [Streptomyces sp. NPDC051572]|uniref:hypothetical protein n=1 Tax=Streptomyces sp. NPDC051572 TaxID=3155802 RepID=UPI00344F236F